MPRTRSELARDAKVGEIVAVARRRLVDGGFASLSVAAIARELGLAQNAVYWYFPTRDHLFVAAVEQLLHDVLAAKPARGGPVEHVLWMADRLAEMQDLRVTLHERARVAEVAAGFERDVVALFRTLLVGAIGDDDDVVDAVLALCDGILLRELGTRRRRALIRFGFERLVGSA